MSCKKEDRRREQNLCLNFAKRIFRSPAPRKKPALGRDLLVSPQCRRGLARPNVRNSLLGLLAQASLGRVCEPPAGLRQLRPCAALPGSRFPVQSPPRGRRFPSRSRGGKFRNDASSNILSRTRRRCWFL